MANPKYRRIKLSNEKFGSAILSCASPLGLQLLCCGPGMWHLSPDGRFMDSAGFQVMVVSARRANEDEAQAATTWRSWMETYISFLESVSSHMPK
jgi:hypothetical protein